MKKVMLRPYVPRTNTKWSDEDVTTLIQANAEGLTNQEIQRERLPHRTIAAVASKLEKLGIKPNYTIYFEKIEAAQVEKIKLRDRWPHTARFSDVTPTEARQIAAGAPRSARYSRVPNYSIYGSAAAMCADQVVSNY